MSDIGRRHDGLAPRREEEKNASVIVDVGIGRHESCGNAPTYDGVPSYDGDGFTITHYMKKEEFF